MLDPKKRQELQDIADSLDGISDKLDAAGESASSVQLDKVIAQIRLAAAVGDPIDLLANLLASGMKDTLDTHLKNALITPDALDQALDKAKRMITSGP